MKDLNLRIKAVNGLCVEKEGVLELPDIIIQSIADDTFPPRVPLIILLKADGMKEGECYRYEYRRFLGQDTERFDLLQGNKVCNLAEKIDMPIINEDEWPYDVWDPDKLWNGSIYHTIIYPHLKTSRYWTTEPNDFIIMHYMTSSDKMILKDIFPGIMKEISLGLEGGGGVDYYLHHFFPLTKVSGKIIILDREFQRLHALLRMPLVMLLIQRGNQVILPELILPKIP